MLYVADPPYDEAPPSHRGGGGIRPPLDDDDDDDDDEIDYNVVRHHDSTPSTPRLYDVAYVAHDTAYAGHDSPRGAGQYGFNACQSRTSGRSQTVALVLFIIAFLNDWR